MLEKQKLGDFFSEFLTGAKKNYIDLHIHTKASDGLIDIEFLKEFLVDIPHLISITDHNTISSNVELYQTEGMNVVPGIEVGCKDGFEFLIYFQDINELIDFYNNHVKPFKNKNKITRTKQNYNYYLVAAREYNSLISIPHITGLAQKNYLKNKDYIHQVTAQVNAIETYNHTLSKKRNFIAKGVRKAKKKSATFGSDAHIKKEIISFFNYQNHNFSRSFYLKKNLYNLCSIIALFGKHIYQLLPLS